jgi:hypothetical protein
VNLSPITRLYVRSIPNLIKPKEEEQWVDNHCSCCYFCISFARQIDI